MRASRRKILMFGGAAAVVTVAGGLGVLATPSLSRAAAPWLAAGQGFRDVRLSALSYAILAPNPHNLQPWQFALVRDDTIDIMCDPEKRLDATDPFDRQITIGFGCMIELLRQAAAELGYSAQVDPFPDGAGQPRLDGGRIARVRFATDAPSRDPLFARALSRRSTKEPYDERDVSQGQFAQLADAVAPRAAFGHSSSGDRLEALRANAMRAWLIEQETAATRRESIELMRLGNDAVVAEPDGIDMGGIFMSAAHAAGVVTQETLDTPGSMAYQGGVDLYRSLVDSTRHWLWITTPGNTRIEQLQAGAAWIRLNLAADAQGLAVHPWSHVLQEFPEMADAYRELHAMLAPGGETIQMFARVGYGPKVDASPAGLWKQS